MNIIFKKIIANNNNGRIMLTEEVLDSMTVLTKHHVTQMHELPGDPPDTFWTNDIQTFRINKVTDSDIIPNFQVFLTKRGQGRFACNPLPYLYLWLDEIECLFYLITDEELLKKEIVSL